MKPTSRRGLLGSGLALTALAADRLQAATTGRPPVERAALHVKTSLNAFSFNAPLMSGAMTIDDMLAFCSDVGFQAVDLTAYYLPGYPTVPPDEVLYRIKRDAFLRGLGISGTGVRNDFTEADRGKRRASVQLVKDWIVAAQKLGAPVIRIFAGVQNPASHSRAQVIDWMVDDIRDCVAFGERHGVVVALQNHHDFIKLADDIVDIARRIDSRWFGVILDTGSYRIGDPYAEIAKTLPYAVNWQVKEKVWIDGQEADTDLPRLVAMIQQHGYRGYVPIETLGPGDPKQKVRLMLGRFRQALG